LAIKDTGRRTQVDSYGNCFCNRNLFTVFPAGIVFLAIVMGEVELRGFARLRLGIGVEIAKRVLNVEGLIPTGTLLGLLVASD